MRMYTQLIFFLSTILVCAPLRFAVNGPTLYFFLLSMYSLYFILFSTTSLSLVGCLHARQMWVSVNAKSSSVGTEHWQMKQLKQNSRIQPSTKENKIQQYREELKSTSIHVYVCKRIGGTQLFLANAFCALSHWRTIDIKMHVFVVC